MCLMIVELQSPYASQSIARLVFTEGKFQFCIIQCTLYIQYGFGHAVIEEAIRCKVIQTSCRTYEFEALIHLFFTVVKIRVNQKDVLKCVFIIPVNNLLNLRNQSSQLLFKSRVFNGNML